MFSWGVQNVFWLLDIQDCVVVFVCCSLVFFFMYYCDGCLLVGVYDYGDGGFDNGIVDVGCQIYWVDLYVVLVVVFVECGLLVVFDYGFVGIDEILISVIVKFFNGDVVGGDVLIGVDGVCLVVWVILWGSDSLCFIGQIVYCFFVFIDEVCFFMSVGWGGVFFGFWCIFNCYILCGGVIVNCVGIVVIDEWVGEGWLMFVLCEDIFVDFVGWYFDVFGLIGFVKLSIKWGIFDCILMM